MKALITAGGHGTRLRPITHTQNKHLIPIANKLMLAYALEYVQASGITEVGIVINAGDETIRETFGDGTNLGLHLTYIPQEAPLGLAHVVKIAEPFIGSEPFVFYLGDNILVGGIAQFIKDFNQNGADCHLVLSKVPDPNRFGVAEIQEGRILSIEEKPTQPKSDLAVTGIYLYTPVIFEAVNNINPSPRGELEISDAHQYLLDHGYTVTYSEITGWWKDTGKPSDLLEANRLVLDNLKEERQAAVVENSTLAGRVSLGPGSQIIDTNIRGPVIIGNNTRLEKAYVGPYTSIGDDCVIRNSEVEFSIIMERCEILDIQKRIEASLLGADVQIRRSARKPLSHRFMVGDQSRVEID
ncbi:MAG: glucose-1-phosphate thymidylyltransferase [Fidelibacterota bacterium]